MDSFITQAQTKCPSTKLSIGGYSQGAQVLHNAVTTLSASAQSFITSVVVSFLFDSHPSTALLTTSLGLRRPIPGNRHRQHSRVQDSAHLPRR